MLGQECCGVLQAGVRNPDALAEQMTAAEDNKFRLFSFLNELNAEVEAMGQQISLLQQELEASSKKVATKQEEDAGMQRVLFFCPQTLHSGYVPGTLFSLA